MRIRTTTCLLGAIAAMAACSSDDTVAPTETSSSSSSSSSSSTGSGGGGGAGSAGPSGPAGPGSGGADGEEGGAGGRGERPSLSVMICETVCITYAECLDDGGGQGGGNGQGGGGGFDDMLAQKCIDACTPDLEDCSPEQLDELVVCADPGVFECKHAAFLECANGVACVDADAGLPAGSDGAGGGSI